MKRYTRSKRDRAIRGLMLLGWGPREIRNHLETFAPKLLKSSKGKLLTEQRIGQIMEGLQHEQ